jgi:hypothetical protein
MSQNKPFLLLSGVSWVFWLSDRELTKTSTSAIGLLSCTVNISIYQKGKPGLRELMQVDQGHMACKWYNKVPELDFCFSTLTILSITDQDQTWSTYTQIISKNCLNHSLGILRIGPGN